MSSSFCILFSISRPLLPRFRLSVSEESAICLSSSNTTSGITSGPSTNPVLQISAIRPSIITLVSKIFGNTMFSFDFVEASLFFLNID